jgi:hypothetical protein
VGETLRRPRPLSCAAARPTWQRRVPDGRLRPDGVAGNGPGGRHPTAAPLFGDAEDRVRSRPFIPPGAAGNPSPQPMRAVKSACPMAAELPSDQRHRFSVSDYQSSGSPAFSRRPFGIRYDRPCRHRRRTAQPGDAVDAPVRPGRPKSADRVARRRDLCIAGPSYRLPGLAQER